MSSKENFIPNGYMTIAQATKILNLSKGGVQYYIRNGGLSSIKIGHKLFVCASDVKTIKQSFITPVGTLTVKQAASRLSCSEYNILTYIKSNKLPNAVFKNHRIGHLVPESDVDALADKIKIPEGYLKLKDVAKRLALTPETVRKYIKENRFPSAMIRNQTEGYLISEKDILLYEKSIAIPQGYFTVSQVAEKLSCHEESIRERLRHGEFPNFIFDTYGHKGRYLISEVDFINFEKSFKLNGYITITEAADRLSCHKDTIRNYIKQNILPNVILRTQSEGYLIPEKDIENIKSANTIPPGYLTIDKVAERLKLSISYTKLLVLNNKFLNAHKTAYGIGSWIIPETDVVEYEKNISKNFTPENEYEFTTIDAINKFKHKTMHLDVPNPLLGSYNLYTEFVNHAISNSKANGETLIKKVAYYARTIETLIQILPREVHLLTDGEIENILQIKNIPDYVKQYFVSYLQYCAKRINCNYKHTYNFSNKDPEDADTYTLEQFLDYYNYVKNIEVLIYDAIKTKTIAQTWLFVLMHMINAWRKSDIIYGLPTIDLDDIKVNSLSYFEKNRLSLEQSQSILNQVYVKVGKFRISKTGALGQFLCNRDLTIPFATVIVIVELHRRKSKDVLLLSSIKNKGINTGFFRHKQYLSNFKSLKMNRTLLTHFFHHITESGKDADISYELTRTMRYHKDENSTKVYIQFTNDDGPLDKVSLNLFNRGHFGWLYNSMINLCTDQNTQTMEERTKLIQVYRENYTPLQLENMSNFLLKERNEITSLPLRLALMPKEEIRIKLKKIFLGKMPAKMTNAQCFTFPECHSKTSTSCLNCEYIIPKVYLLFSIDAELKKLIESIKSTKYETIRERDTFLLFRVLSILNQAAVDLGKEYVEAFINLNELQETLNKLEKMLSV